ncbi:hypothetical protein [Parasedimentitalea psychrophila]|uniref:Uncharacterized protein n=1 Tax=Parasedimentitalea psychrophila TaxID=2997337 RepID=A0A9Y2KYY4_9RHOB|nr:hypothetical protein [Parasedimentitalea psychrophila]WIY25103.1 hypothetical protein QPJ95_21870 [Parasedimentitalea psychrophila]
MEENVIEVNNEKNSINDIVARIENLEDEIVNKKKTTLEVLRDYGGVLALIIAIGYSWPIGVWDRFIGGREESIEVLRESIITTSQLMSEINQVVASINDPNLRDGAVRPIQNRLISTLSTNKEEYNRHLKRFSTDELVQLSIAYLFVYDAVQANRVLVEVSGRADLTERQRLNAHQGLAISYYIPSEMQDTEYGRELYVGIVDELSNQIDANSSVFLISLRADWGMNELMVGDWKCGTKQVSLALEQLENWQHLADPQGFLREIYSDMLKNSPMPRPGQPVKGC